MKLSYENTKRLETLFFLGVIGLSFVAVSWLMMYGNEWSMEMAKYFLGIK